ncbi:DNA repair protein RAD14 [Mycena indigotica]|uniref:DNA repair protein RAD14 n=1 Tax=Mycena indigotica TaxID=2126181 RepID=A0A8H6W5K8_9AGAR|nr:DNA repair protein RAD14 [Mycena indigotica]KAF7306644.1 DNA repair protein RAD14 [Mycena indigotica]
MMDRLATPPPQPSSSVSLQLTPEQVRQVELNRLRAKAAQRKREEDAAGSSAVNANNKRPLGVTPANSNSPTAPGPSKAKPLKRDARYGPIFEFDLSKMSDPRGGYMPVEHGQDIDEEVVRKEKERERQRIEKNLKLDDPIYLDNSLNPHCRECGSVSIDPSYRKNFSCLVCKTCQNDNPEKYSLLTKTECKQDYLLTDSELRDEKALPHMLKANPHKSTYANMMLYARYQVEEFAWKKWGSPEALDAEYEKPLHCYFLLSASASVPIVYFVERLRNGRSYITRAVKAVQNGKMVFFMMCSFHKPEPWQPVGQWSMPPNVPPPEDCPTEEERYQVLLKKEGLDADMRKIYVDIIAERKRSPIAVKPALEKDRVSGGSGMTRYMFWLQARDIPKYEPHFQKCILSYMSDLYVLGVAARTLGLERVGKGPNVRSMTSTIDHAVAFYDDTFDCGDWLLYVMASPRAASGRAIVYGQIYKRDGTLVAITTQEGVVRANRRGPEPAKL